MSAGRLRRREEGRRGPEQTHDNTGTRRSACKFGEEGEGNIMVKGETQQLVQSISSLDHRERERYTHLVAALQS